MTSMQVGAKRFDGVLQFGVGALLRLACAVVVAVVVAALVALASRLLADALGVLDGSAGGWLPLRHGWLRGRLDSSCVSCDACIRGKAAVCLGATRFRGGGATGAVSSVSPAGMGAPA
jgi:hypothetical protein